MKSSVVHHSHTPPQKSPGETHLSPTHSGQYDAHQEDTGLSPNRHSRGSPQNRRPSIAAGAAYARRPSISSNVPRTQRSFSITSNDITLPIPHQNTPQEDSLSPRLPSALTSFKRPSPSSRGQEQYPYHMDIIPQHVLSLETLLTR